MADVSIKVMSMNPKREYNIKVKGLNSEQLPDYVTKTYRDLIDLLGAEQVDIQVGDGQLLVEQDVVNKRIKEHCDSNDVAQSRKQKEKYPDTDLQDFYKP